MRWRLANSTERSITTVPGLAMAALAVAFCTQVGWQAFSAAPQAGATALEAPAEAAWLRVAAFGDSIALSQMLVLYLQAFDNQPGISVPYAELDYEAVMGWLKRALELDPEGQYPLMMASHLYSLVPDEGRQRQMLGFVHQEFLRDPDRRWRWLAHAAIVAKHRLNDPALALVYADDISRHASQALGWARQMRIFILADMGESQAAAVLLGGLLASGEVTDAAEIRFLTERLGELKSDEKSSSPSKSR